MVTYNNEIVITPYFGNADTRTRSWTEVWGGKEKPWLVPVDTTYDDRDNKKLFGHGVGMSQRDAAYRADETGADFITLLKYYYTGVDVSKIY
jgi:peptidoglycan hydrolase-like amidase